MSKNGKCFFSLMTFESSLHWLWVGSTPVGCRKKTTKDVRDATWKSEEKGRTL